MEVNSAFIRILSLRTFREASASRLARIRAWVSRFIRFIARRMYSARDSLSAPAHRPLWLPADVILATPDDVERCKDAEGEQLLAVVG